MFKYALLVLLPLVALFGPVAFYSAPEWWSKITDSGASDSSANAPGKKPNAGPAKPDVDKALLAGKLPLPGLEGAPVHDLAEVLRFDVSPGWVVARWPRVSTGLAQLQLQGYRVPLVTGTARDDLAGALTYYFNPRQEMQRLTFHGTTGDARKLVHLVTTRYGLARRLTNDPGMFLYERQAANGEAKSFLWIRPAAVVKANDPLGRLEVALLLERPEET